MEFVYVLFVFLVYLLVVISKQNKRSRYFFLTIGFLWVATITMSLFNPFDLYPVSPYIYFIASLGFVSLFCGYSIQTARKRVNPCVMNWDEQLNIVIKTKLFIIPFVVSLGVVLFLAITQWRVVLMQEGLGNIKIDLFELVFGGNSLLYFLYQTIAFPMFHLTAFLLSYMLLKKGNVIPKVILIIYVFLFCFLGGKRGFFATFIEYFVIVIIMTMLATSKKKKNNRRSLFGLVIVIVVTLLGASFMTSLSGGLNRGSAALKESNISNLENAIVYRVGAYRALQHGIEHDYLGRAGGLSFGRASFGGWVDYYGAPLLQKIGLPVHRITEKTMAQLQRNIIMIGPDRSFNFVYTSFMYFYFDYWYLGILIIPFFFGMFIRYCVDKSWYDGSLISLAFVCYLFVSCILFDGTWFFAAVSAQPIFIYFYLIRKKTMRLIQLKQCNL